MAGIAETFLAGADALNRRDLDALLEVVDDGIHFEPLRAATEGAFHGHDGVRAFWRDTDESFEVFELDYPDVRELPDGRVLALGSIRIRGRGSGVETNVPTAVIASMQEGRMVQFKDYGDHDVALAAAGVA
jgi:ketosteroid isomerase-like protein